MNNFISDFFLFFYLFGFAAVEGLIFGNTTTFYKNIGQGKML
jgi:hypothetical protein